MQIAESGWGSLSVKILYLESLSDSKVFKSNVSVLDNKTLFSHTSCCKVLTASPVRYDSIIGCILTGATL
nr:hypothetical protein [Klebsiella pneumoniae]